MASSSFEKDVEKEKPQLGKHTSSETELKVDGSGEVNHLSRRLKNRHVALIRYVFDAGCRQSFNLTSS